MKKMLYSIFVSCVGLLSAVPPTGELDLRGALPESIKTVAIVMPASILPQSYFNRGKAALEAAGYRVKVMPRLDFKKVASVEDRVADFEQAWMDPEVDLVLCARGGTGAEDLLGRLDWDKLRTRKQRVLGFSNITMLLNAMLKEKAGHPFSGPSLSHFLYAERASLDWLAPALAEAPLPEVKLRVLKPGACRGLACGGHVSLVLKGVQMGWAAETKGRIVFLECVGVRPAGIRKMLTALEKRGYFSDCAGVVFGDITFQVVRTKEALADEDGKLAASELEQVKKDFAARMSCPVYDGYPYGHVPKSYAIDFLRGKSISAEGVLRQ